MDREGATFATHDSVLLPLWFDEALVIEKLLDVAVCNDCMAWKSEKEKELAGVCLGPLARLCQAHQLLLQWS